MADDPLKYQDMVEDAMRGVVRDALREAAKHGLPGDHHFFITFETGAPGTEISNRLRAQHPEEMTIAIQHRFWNLAVDETGFSVELSFSGRREYLYVPFAALARFMDPSVKFGLQFSNTHTPAHPTAEGEDAAPRSSDQDQETGDRKAAAGGEGAAGEKIVSLDSFRKK